MAVTCSTVAAPSIAAVVESLGENNASGMVPGNALGAITLPPCTQADESPLEIPVVYSVSDLPAWLAFDASTRALSLNGAATVPDAAYASSTVTYRCAAFASVSFAVNDLDRGGVTDGVEYVNGAVPLLNNQGSIQLNSSNVVLYRGGTETFTIPTSITIADIGMDPTDPADDVADFDGDLLTNLVEGQAGTNIFVAESAGTLSWESSVDLSAATAGLEAPIVAGDFDGDGNLDLVAGGLAAIGPPVPRVFVMLGNGDGTFDAAVLYSSSGVIANAPYAITTADFNGDGDLDIATANSSNSDVSILLGVGDGTFGASSSFAVGANPRGIAVADFNGDGNVDIVTADNGGNTLSVLLGEGDGSFGAAVSYDVGTAPLHVTAGDFDDDGDLDLVSGNATSKNLSVLLGAGDGTFADAVAYAVDADLSTLGGLVAGDFDSDRVLDLAVSYWGAGFVGYGAVFLGAGDGTFGAVSKYSVDEGDRSEPRDLAAVDMDGDGILDLVMPCNEDVGDSSISILPGVGDGTFGAVAKYTVKTDLDDIGDVAVGDYDNDGAIDTASIDVTGKVAAIMLND